METKKNIGEAKIVGQPKAPFRFKLKDGCVKSNHLAEESVATGNIQNAAVSTEKIMDEAVTKAKIMNGAITNSKISNGTITNEKIANNSIDNSKIQDLTLTGDKFTDNSIDGSKIKDNSVLGSKLADGAIESIDLQDNTLSGSKLADNSVDGDKLIDGAVTSEKLKDNSIDGSKIADGTIQSLDIKDGSISGSKLVDNSISGTKLSDGIITNNKIADNSITGDKFLDESISGEKIQANTIHGSKLEDNTVDGADIIEGTLNGSKIADMSIDGDKLADASIETRHIKSNTISGSKIVTNSIDSTKIRNNSLIGENFEDGAITNAKIVDDAVTNSKIANNTIASDKIADGAITTIKLANSSVGGASIADNAITNDKLQDGSIVNRNIATGTLTGDKFVDNTITGDKIIDNTLPGSKIKDGTIENVDIKDNTLSGAKLVNNSVDGTKLADNSITSSHLIDNSIPGSKIKDGTIENVDIKDGTLDGSKIKDNTITGAKLADDVIPSTKLSDNSITTDKIVDNAVTGDKLADGAITSNKIADDVITELQTIMDEVPTAGSVKPVQSGGVQNELALGAVYDVSAKNPTAGHNSDGKWESLSSLLSDANLNTLIPTTVRKGGMSIKFVLSSDNKYVQYRLTTATWSSVVNNWQRYDVIKAENVAFNQPVFNLQKGIYIPHNTPSYWDVVNYEVGILDNTGAISRAQSAYSNYKTFTFDISDYIGKELTLIITSGASNYASAWPAFVTVDELEVKTVHHASGQPTVQYGYTTVNYTPVAGDKYLKASSNDLVYLMCGLDFTIGFNKPIMIFPETKTLINTKSEEINYPVLNYFNDEAEGIEYGGYYVGIDSEGNPIWHSSGNYAESDYIPVESSDIYKTTFDVQGNITSTNWVQVATMMYNADKEAVRFIANPGGHLVAREGEAYCRFAFNYRNGNKYDISINSNVDAYHPYQAENLTIKQYIAQIEAHIQTLYDSVNLRIDDLNSRLSEITGDGSQWIGKTWYAYGTSITSISQGRYVPYLAALSQMNVVNKGIAGGGIGNLGAYSTGQVRAAIMNITDGKLDADLITLEVGANDTGEDVPLGTIYDNDDTTLCGCLNMCIRYLQENTNAQVVIMPSPATTTEPNAANKYYEAQWLFKQVCFVNKCWWIDGMTNLGWAKITRTDIRYVRDNIHQTELGGYVFARSIWAELKKVPLFYTAIPE